MADSSQPAATPSVRAAEIAASLCLATDAGMGFAWEHGFTATMSAMRLCDLPGVDAPTRQQTYYISLLTDVGCNADAALRRDNGQVLPLYLVRHGESEWNARNLIQGQTAHPRLTAAGRDQAYGAAELIGADLAARGLAVDAITTSDLARATETASILAEVLGGRLSGDVRLREQQLGDLEGLTKDQARSLQETQGQRVDAGEVDEALRARMAAAVADLDRSAVQIVVSHRRALRQVSAHLLGLPDGERIAIPNGAVACWYAEDLVWLG